MGSLPAHPQLSRPRATVDHVLPALAFIVLVLVVAAIAWHMRGRPVQITCCHHAQWPPDDITQRTEQRAPAG